MNPQPAPSVVMYSTQWCPYCEHARRLLRSKDVEFMEIDVESANHRQEMQQRSGRRTVPQIFIGDTLVGGNDDLYALEAQGGLDTLLKRI